MAKASSLWFSASNKLNPSQARSKHSSLGPSDIQLSVKGAGRKAREISLLRGILGGDPVGQISTSLYLTFKPLSILTNRYWG